MVPHVDLVFRATSVTQYAKELAMQLRFLGKVTEGGNSPTLWDTDEDEYVIQGFTTLDAETSSQVGTVPTGEAVIRVPKALMQLLPKEDDAATDG
jgi:hypothetical protein